MKPSLSLPCLLAASPSLRDESFSRAVVLLLEHDRNGALGFVINNKSSMTVGEVVAFDQSNIPDGIPVWNAGPIDPSSGFILHNRHLGDYEQEVAPGVCLSASQESLKKLIAEAHQFTLQLEDSPTGQRVDVLYPYRLLVGYAGWGPGQLEAEIKQGSWIQAPLDLDILFNLAYGRIWQRTIDSAGVAKNSRRTAADSRYLH